MLEKILRLRNKVNGKEVRGVELFSFFFVKVETHFILLNSILK